MPTERTSKSTREVCSGGCVLERYAGFDPALEEEKIKMSAYFKVSGFVG